MLRWRGRLSAHYQATIRSDRVVSRYHIYSSVVSIHMLTEHNLSTHILDFRHVIPSRLLTPEETLNTSDMNQNKFTTSHTVLPGFIAKDVWRAVAVTLEKNVAIVVMFTYRVMARSFSSARNIGSADKSGVKRYSNKQRQWNIHLSPNFCSSSATACIASSVSSDNRFSHMYLSNSVCWYSPNRPMLGHCKRGTAPLRQLLNQVVVKHSVYRQSGSI